MKQPQTRVSLLRLAPEIWKYQIVTKLLLALVLYIFRLVATRLLRSTGRVAVSSGDYAFLFRTWQGPLLLLIFLAIFFFYVSFDLNVKILYGGNVTDGVQESVPATCKRALAALPRFLNSQGLGVVLYVTLIAPLVGAGLGVSLTQNLKIPNFIFSVIQATPLYYAVYILLVLAFAVVGVAHIFCLHGVLLEGLSIRLARRRSKALMRRHWRDFMRWNVGYAARALGWTLLVIALAYLVPLAVAGAVLSRANVTMTRYITILIVLLASLLTGALSLLVTPYYVIRVTQLYREYSKGVPIPIPKRTGGGYLLPALTAVVAVGVSVGLSALAARNFDEVFPQKTVTQIISHRGGGNEAPENTLAGLKTAISLGAYGSEIDIQRTSDGYYIVNHDANFQRVAGDPRTPAEMTLEEVRQLRVKNSDQPVATFEEMLDAANGRILLFVELKGDTADEKMCDDAVQAVKDRNMLDCAVLISMKYELIEYIEANYPEIQTGYLVFMSYGKAADLPCDFLGLEEASVTSSAIDAVHAQGKKFLVWTPNTLEAQEYFLTTKADGIITDEVVQAEKIVERLNRRNDFERILSAFGQ